MTRMIIIRTEGQSVRALANVFIAKEIRDTQLTQHLPAESCLFDSCGTLRNRQRYSGSCYVIAQAYIFI